MKNRLYAYFDTKPSVAYPIVEGSTYVQTFNEELDSMNIIIDGVGLDGLPRIELDRPYHFVKIQNDLGNLEHLIEISDVCLMVEMKFNEEPKTDIEYGFLMRRRPFKGETPDVDETFNMLIEYDGVDYYAECVVTRFTGLPSARTLHYEILSLEGNVNSNGNLLFNGKKYMIMLVDTFVETPMTLEEPIIYKYQIGLMNCVKLLEKIQCPNLVLSHSLTDKNKSLWVCIDNYMKLYCPKIKKSTNGRTWSYEYLLDWSALNVEPFNNTPCADMQMNEPTLRELLTNLMLQVSCIPYVSYTKLKFINFKEAQSNVVVNNGDGINYIVGSIASDSYSNTLVVSPSQTLSDKESINAELVGFRDSSNAIIRQTENLQIEVRKPIYKINSLLMRSCENIYGYPVPYNLGAKPEYVLLGYMNPSLYNGSDAQSKYEKGGFSISCDSVGNLTFYFRLLYAKGVYITRDFNNVSISNLKIHFMLYDSDNDYYEEIETLGFSTVWELEPASASGLVATAKGFHMYANGTIESDDNLAVPISLCHTQNFLFDGLFNISGIYSPNDFLDVVSHIWIEFNIGDKHCFQPMTALKQYQSGKFYADIIRNGGALGFQSNITSYNALYPADTPMPKLMISASRGPYVDLTPIVKENKKRQLLEVDYQLMDSVVADTNSTLEDLGKYIYGTLGYTIGDNKITGFSNTYKYGTWWLWNYVDKEKSYFDLIIDFISARKNLVQFDSDKVKEEEKDNINTYIKGIYGSNANIPYTAFFIDYDDSINNWLSVNYPKMKMLFSVNYQPLENIKLRLSKENKDAPHLIEQLNQSGDGLSDFERLLLHNQENANRIGNLVKSLPQTTDDISKLKPLNGLYGKYTIFRREFSIYEPVISVNYTASEEYVLKNYFTSIITKYRAYQYIDYNEAVERKENTIIYGMISSKHYYNGDDKIKLYDNLYSYDDIADALGISVSDLKTNYINYSSDGNKIFDMKNKVQFDIADLYIPAIFGVSAQEHHEEHIVIDYKSGETEITSEVLPSDPGNITLRIAAVYPFNYDSFFFNNWKSAWNDILVYNSEIVHLRSFLETQFPGYFEEGYASYDKASLLKMDGFILKDDDLDKYYIIHVSSTATLTPVPSATDVPISTYNYLQNNVFGTIVNRMKDMMPSGYADFITYYVNGHIDISVSQDNVKIYLEEVSESEVEERLANQKPFQTVFLSGLIAWSAKRNFKVNLEIEKSLNESGGYEEVKNECSSIAYKNGLVFNYQNYDNVSAGICLHTLTPQWDAQQNVGNKYATGGIVQRWQLWNQDVYNNFHSVKFCFDLTLNPTLLEADIGYYVKNLPIITLGWTYKQYELFEVVNNISPNNDSFTFFKDYAEYLNHTVQFEFYNPDGDVFFNQNLFDANRMIGNLECSEILICEATESNFGIDKYDFDEDDILSDNLKVDYDVNFKLPYFEVPWSDFPECDYIVIVGLCNGAYINLIAIKKLNNDDTRYYLTLNDTKTNDVWYFANENDLFTLYECDNPLEGSTDMTRNCSIKNS